MLKTNEDSGRPAAGAGGGEYLTFTLGQEHYGIDILQVREIRSYEKTTRIAGAASHFLGVLNLRGAIIPIVDLRQLLAGSETTHIGGQSAIVIICVDEQMLGLLVDGVSDVRRIDAAQMRALPALSTGAEEAGMVAGLADVDGQNLLLLDLDRVALCASGRELLAL